jgi:hypothetical protein
MTTPWVPAPMISMPAINGEPVTEAHTRHCAQYGHAIHTLDNVDTGICPRCGTFKGASRDMQEGVRNMEALGDRNRVPAGEMKGGEEDTFSRSDAFLMLDAFKAGWIGWEGEETGQLVKDASFDALLLDIDLIRDFYPASGEWQKACDHYVSITVTGYAQLRVEITGELTGNLPSYSDVPFHWRSVYARVFKDCVYRGTIMLSRAVAYMGAGAGVDMNDERDA